jgi:hypothetical protein
VPKAAGGSRRAQRADLGAGWIDVQLKDRPESAESTANADLVFASAGLPDSEGCWKRGFQFSSYAASMSCCPCLSSCCERIERSVSNSSSRSRAAICSRGCSSPRSCALTREGSIHRSVQEILFQQCSLIAGERAALIVRSRENLYEPARLCQMPAARGRRAVGGGRNLGRGIGQRSMNRHRDARFAEPSEREAEPARYRNRQPPTCLTMRTRPSSTMPTTMPT